MTDYHIYGRPFAGSLIAEFLFTAADCSYTLSFPDEMNAIQLNFWLKTQQAAFPC